jgi:hypothetical protein
VAHFLRCEPRNTSPGILLVDILKTSFLFLIFLVALNAIEEVGLGFFHGPAAREVLGEMAGGTLPEAEAPVVRIDTVERQDGVDTLGLHRSSAPVHVRLEIP